MHHFHNRARRCIWKALSSEPAQLIKSLEIKDARTTKTPIMNIFYIEQIGSAVGYPLPNISWHLILQKPGPGIETFVHIAWDS
jgi:hypothetical protein